MPKFLLIDEFHIGVSVPRALRDAEVRAVRRSLDAKTLHVELHRAIRRVFRRRRSLRQATVTITR